MAFCETSAFAQAQAPNITWRAPADCGTSAELELAVLRLLREGVTVPDPLSFAGNIEPTPDQHWLLTLHAASGSGSWSRQLVGATCIELRDAAVVLMALAIDPNVGERTSPSTSSAALNGSSTASNVDSHAATNESATPPAIQHAQPSASRGTLGTQLIVPISKGNAERPASSTPAFSERGDVSGARLLATLRAGLASGIVPEPTPTLLLGAAPTWKRFRISGELGWLRPQTRYAPWSPERGARIGAWSASLHGGYVGKLRQAELSLSAGAFGGYLYGQSVGPERGSTTEGAAWIAAAARLSAFLPLTRGWFAYAATDAWYVLGAPRFKLRVSDERLLFEPSPLGGLFSLGIAVRLW